MPIKIGKSKSNAGSELINQNPCSDETVNQTKKNRSLRQFFNRSKSNSKTSTGRPITTDEISNNVTTKAVYEEKVSDENLAYHKESITNNNCHFLSTKLCPNGSLLLNDDSMKPALPALPFHNVIMENDYEEALLLNNRNISLIRSESDNVPRENNHQQVNGSNKNTQGIYNEPNDSAHGSRKEVIETCRLYQITPTNQFKEIRSRSGSGNDPLIVQPDNGVGDRVSTNSSSVGSAQTLSESSVVVSSSYSPQVTVDPLISSNIPPLHKSIAPSTTELSVNIQANNQATSGPPTAYIDSPKGNAGICHHPSSPFVPLNVLKPNSSSNISNDNRTMADQFSTTHLNGLKAEEIKCNESTRNVLPIANTLARTSVKYSNSAAVDSNCSSVKSKSNIPQFQKHSERHSEHNNQYPVYEEAWDLKLRRMCQDMSERSTQSSLDGADTNVLISNGFDAIESNRPQSASDARRKNDSTKFSTPPAVPPHRRSSIHLKLNHSNSAEVSKPSTSHSHCSHTSSDDISNLEMADDNQGQKSVSKSHLKHNINLAFDDVGLAADYDYAYNETWNLGVQENMSRNLLNNVNAVSRTQRTDKVVPVSKEFHSLQSDSITDIESHICETVSSARKEEEPPNVDNDSLSNDSYEEPWDVRHGRVISELTSARLIDPMCVLPVHEQTPSAKNISITSKQRNRNENHSTRRIQEHSSSPSSSHGTRQSSFNGGRQLSTVPTLPSVTMINVSIPLEEQIWFHGDCSRSRAEQLLSVAVEGSFLVRRSETSQSDYSFTIRHNGENLHMKISSTPRGFILGQYSQPYVTIPHMLHHYSLTMVPVKGADSVMLKNPIIR